MISHIHLSQPSQASFKAFCAGVTGSVEGTAVDAVSLDFSKASDTISYPKLIKYIPGKHGAPQGWMLEPPQCNVFISDLCGGTENTLSKSVDGTKPGAVADSPGVCHPGHHQGGEMG